MSIYIDSAASAQARPKKKKNKSKTKRGSEEREAAELAAGLGFSYDSDYTIASSDEDEGEEDGDLDGFVVGQDEWHPDDVGPGHRKLPNYKRMRVEDEKDALDEDVEAFAKDEAYRLERAREKAAKQAKSEEKRGKRLRKRIASSDDEDGDRMATESKPAAPRKAPRSVDYLEDKFGPHLRDMIKSQRGNGEFTALSPNVDNGEMLSFVTSLSDERIRRLMDAYEKTQLIEPPSRPTSDDEEDGEEEKQRRPNGSLAEVLVDHEAVTDAELAALPEATYEEVDRARKPSKPTNADFESGLPADHSDIKSKTAYKQASLTAFKGLPPPAAAASAYEDRYAVGKTFAIGKQQYTTTARGKDVPLVNNPGGVKSRQYKVNYAEAREQHVTQAVTRPDRQLVSLLVNGIHVFACVAGSKELAIIAKSSGSATTTASAVVSKAEKPRSSLKKSKHPSKMDADMDLDTSSPSSASAKEKPSKARPARPRGAPAPFPMAVADGFDHIVKWFFDVKSKLPADDRAKFFDGIKVQHAALAAAFSGPKERYMDNLMDFNRHLVTEAIDATEKVADRKERARRIVAALVKNQVFISMLTTPRGRKALAEFAAELKKGGGAASQKKKTKTAEQQAEEEEKDMKRKGIHVLKPDEEEDGDGGSDDEDHVKQDRRQKLKNKAKDRKANHHRKRRDGSDDDEEEDKKPRRKRRAGSDDDDDEDDDDEDEYVARETVDTDEEEDDD